MDEHGYFEISRGNGQHRILAPLVPLHLFTGGRWPGTGLQSQQPGRRHARTDHPGQGHGRRVFGCRQTASHTQCGPADQVRCRLETAAASALLSSRPPRRDRARIHWSIADGTSQRRIPLPCSIRQPSSNPARVGPATGSQSRRKTSSKTATAPSAWSAPRFAASAAKRIWGMSSTMARNRPACAIA